MTQLQSLDLGFNAIRYIGELETLISLKILILKCNDIFRIEALEKLVNLSRLDLTENKVIFIKPIKQLKVELIIDGNLIMDDTTLKNQKQPSLQDFKEYLGDNSTLEQADRLF